MGQADMHLVTIRMGCPIQIVSRPVGVSTNIAVERPSGLVQEDTWIRIQSSRACSVDA
jgi:hypothetical protein